MRRHLRFLIAAGVIFLAAASPALASEWIFKRSRYSHDPVTGKQVSQFAPKTPAYAYDDPTYRESGYRHIRRALRGPDGSADRLHIVQEWGEGQAIRPYGEWLYPFRAGATPYGPWGNPGGPWTTPFGSWSNPYGLGQLPHPPWPHYEWPYGYYQGYPHTGLPQQIPHQAPGHSPGHGPGPSGGGPAHSPAYSPGPSPGHPGGGPAHSPGSSSGYR